MRPALLVACALVPLLPGCGGPDRNASTDTGEPDSGEHDSAETGDTADTDTGDTADTGDCAAPTPWYPDADGDTHGDAAATPAEACVAPEGHVATADDCDDAEPTVHPGAAELCNERDDDCDGAVDDEATDTDTRYPDLDADGYGDVDGSPSEGCPADGWARTADDCDDADPARHPDAFDDCYDGVDGDCDGVDATCALWGERTYADADLAWKDDDAVYANTGRSLNFTGDLDGDGRAELLIGAPFYESGGPGRVWIVPVGRGGLTGGELTGLGPSVDGAFRVDGTAAYDGVGDDAVGDGDLDGDGIADLIVGAGAWGTAGDYSIASDPGRVWIWFGPLSADTTVDSADVHLDGAADGDAFGYHTRYLGDVDGDGKDDFSASNSAWDGDTDWYAHVILGASVAAGAHGTSSSAAAHLPGWGVEGLDVDGDGQDDLVNARSGAVDLYAGPLAVSGEVDPATADTNLTGSGGWAYTAAGDYDGDGGDDLAVCAAAASDAYASEGVCVTLLGDAFTTTASIVTVTAGRFTGGVADLGLGREVAAGDVDGDGRDELALGHSGATAPPDLTYGGGAWLYYAAATGTRTAADADVWLYGEEPSDYVGDGLAIGRVDGDAVDDLVVGGLLWGPGYGGTAAVFLGGR